jgi:thiol:disulfide interchange protein DsbD
MPPTNRFVLILIVVVLAAAVVGIEDRSSAAPSDPFDPFEDPVSTAVYTSLSSVPPGGTIDLAVVLRMRLPWHVNAHEVNDDYLIPTTVSVEPPAGVTVRPIVYPAGVEKKLSFSDKPLRLYEDTAYIGIRVDVSLDTEPGEKTLKARVTYQPCDDEKCVAPTTETIEIPLRVSPATEAIDATHAEIFEKINFSGVGAKDGGATRAGKVGSSGGRLGAVIAERGLVFAFIIVFIWGLALNLTPCVYPIIPITVGYFGGQTGGKSSRTLLLAAIYVLGMAVMYSTLGLVAALTGSILGTALQNPFVVGVVALVLVLLALSMFGVYEFRVPAKLGGVAGTAKQGAIGAFLMGLTVGIVAAPCIGPFVLALLTFVGESGSPALGFSLFFTLAVGLGVPFLFLAMLSGSITRLPRSGEWMDWVKKLFGVVLVAMAVFFLQPHIGDVAYFAIMGLWLVAGGIYLGFVRKTRTTALPFRVFKRFVGIAAPLFGLYLIFAPGHIIARGVPSGGIVWKTFDDELLSRAKENRQYVLIDFSAEWCLPCKELDHRTFSHQEVVDATADVLTMKADLTETASPGVARLRKQYAIKGVPTVVFLDRDGKEREDLRVFGFVDKNDFLGRIQRMKGGG